MAERTTMKDVAKKAGVTIGTVSHVINGTASISEETKQRVWKVIEETNYTPNPMASYMRSKKSKIIGLMLPDLNNHFFAKTASQFASLAYQNGYTVLILENSYSPEKEQQNMQILIRNNADAVIIMCGLQKEELLDEFLKKKKIVIFADQNSTCGDIPCIQFDNNKIMMKIVSLLKQRGCDSIGFLCETLELTNIRKRFEAYERALLANGYVYRPEHVFLSKSLRMDHIKNGYSYMKEILSTHKKEELPKAWITSSDLSAVGAIRAMNEAGYRVPEDFAFIGWDNLEISEFISPKLTTVLQNQTRLGHEMWDMFMKCVEEVPTQNIVLEQELIIRESC